MLIYSAVDYLHPFHLNVLLLFDSFKKNQIMNYLSENTMKEEHNAIHFSVFKLGYMTVTIAAKTLRSLDICF